MCARIFVIGLLCKQTHQNKQKQFAPIYVYTYKGCSRAVQGCSRAVHGLFKVPTTFCHATPHALLLPENSTPLLSFLVQGQRAKNMFKDKTGNPFATPRAVQGLFKGQKIPPPFCHMQENSTHLPSAYIGLPENISPLTNIKRNDVGRTKWGGGVVVAS